MMILQRKRVVFERSILIREYVLRLVENIIFLSCSISDE